MDTYTTKDVFNLACEYGHLEIVKLLIPRIDLSKITDHNILTIAKEFCQKSLKEIIESDISLEEKVKELQNHQVSSIRIETDDTGKRVCLVYNI